MSVPTILTRLHGRRAAGVPQWAMLAAYAAALSTLPSSVWRIAGFVFDAPMVVRDAASRPDHGPVLAEGVAYILTLSLVSEVLAVLALGLVCEWGEVWPRWIPGLGGRRVPTPAVVVPAGLGATALLIFPYALAMIASGRMVTGASAAPITRGWQTTVFWIAYLPLAAWGPLLGILTVHYYRRRRSDPALEVSGEGHRRQRAGGPGSGRSAR
jgi:hypothetical protein